jgi:hypothetical protein
MSQSAIQGFPGQGPPRVRGEAILQRLFDVGYEIHLDRAFSLLASSAPERPRPVRGEAQAIQIPNPPITVHLGTQNVPVRGRTQEVELSARLFDFGVISMRARLPAPAWGEWADLGARGGAREAWQLFEPALDRLMERIRPAVERAERARVTEEYVVYRIHEIQDAQGRTLSAHDLTDADAEQLLIGESRPLSAGTRKELLSQRFSYFEDDLTILTWNSALVVEPVAEDTDVQYVLEFANAQLLELRFYDTVLDAELPRTYAEIAAARRGLHILDRRFSRLLATLQTRVADATEAVERAENALKVTDDVYLARIYASALEIFRASTWRRGIDRKVDIIHNAYTMLNAESQARRTEVLELVVVVLIFAEMVLAFLRH